MAVWRLMAHHNDPIEAARWYREQGRIAIGWGGVGDLRQSNNTSPEDLTKAILRGWPESHNAGPGGKQLWDFWRTLKLNDLVIVSVGSRREFVGQIIGDYEWTDAATVPIPEGDYRHQRRIRILNVDPNVIWKAAGGMAEGYSPRWTLIRCQTPEE